MPFLKEQLTIVIDTLKATAFKDERFAGGRYEPIAVDLKRGEQQFPVVMNNSFEAEEITPDDTFPLTVYCKVLNKTYQPSQVQYGTSNNYMTEKSDCKMVVYGKYKKLQLTQEQLEALMATNFPDNIAPAKLSNIGLNNLVVALGSSNLNTISVFNEEYKNVQQFLSNEDIFFSIRFTLTAHYKKGCINICDCNNN